jgi:hypothetical protein
MRGTLQQRFELESWPFCHSEQLSVAPVNLGGRIAALSSNSAGVSDVRTIAVIDYDGRIRFMLKLGKHEMAGKIRSDEHGDRLGPLALLIRGGPSGQRARP